jgi:transcriptional regulator with XRE-family HTH domain
MVRENSGNAGWSFLVFPVIDMAATGSVIKALREQNGYSVQDVQEYFGLDQPQAIYKWQRGETLPSVDNLYALSTLLGEPMKNILVPTGYTVYSRFGGHNQNRKERVKLAQKRREDEKQDRGGDSRM